MNDETEALFRALLSQRGLEGDLTRAERARLKKPVERVRADNIFSSHLSQHTVLGPETDPKFRRRGHYFRAVAVSADGRLTDEQISAEEARLGVRLPPRREVYKHFNGGWVYTLYWGNMDDPRADDIKPIPQSTHEYLALKDVAPLRDLLPNEIGGRDCSSIDPRLIAIASSDGQAMVLDYRSDEPRVCRAHFNEYKDDPLLNWEEDEAAFWWPNVNVFMRGLYLQDRHT